MIIKRLLGSKNEVKNFSKQEKIDLVVNKLRGNHLRISSIQTGGYEILVILSNPVKAAEIAKEAISKSKTIKDVILEKQLLSEKQIDEILDIEKLI